MMDLFIPLIALSAAAVLQDASPPPVTLEGQEPELFSEVEPERRIPPDPFETAPGVEIIRDQSGQMAPGWVRAEGCTGGACSQRVTHQATGRVVQLFDEWQAGCLATGRGQEVVCLTPPDGASRDISTSE